MEIKKETKYILELDEIQFKAIMQSLKRVSSNLIQTADYAIMINGMISEMEKMNESKI